jgi:hypothetical protein
MGGPRLVACDTLRHPPMLGERSIQLWPNTTFVPNCHWRPWPKGQQ